LYPDRVSAFALFETPVGACAIAWRDAGISGLQLPEGSVEATRARAARRYQAAERPLSPETQAAVDGIRALLAGQPSDLASIPLDMHGVPAFNQRVYELARRIPPGHTLTYGDIASRVGGRGRARAVGQALGRNPFAIIVPCHRVVSASGAWGGFSAHGGLELKRRLLELEGMTALPAPLPF
jgi:methylated-DNA-[protein]-cysteine S-methyltransferase